jgi:hypothetical protein
MPNPQARRPPFVGCLWLLIQCICSCLPQMEAVSFIRKPRTHHALVTRGPPNMECQSYRRSKSPHPHCVDLSKGISTKYSASVTVKLAQLSYTFFSLYNYLSSFINTLAILLISQRDILKTYQKHLTSITLKVLERQLHLYYNSKPDTTTFT